MSRAIAAWTTSVRSTLPPAWQATSASLIFAIVLLLLWEVMALPAVLYQGLRLERRFRSAHHQPRELAAAHAQAAVLAGGFVVAATLALRVAFALAGPW